MYVVQCYIAHMYMHVGVSVDNSVSRSVTYMYYL